METRIEIDCGIAYERLASWLDAELAAVQDSKGAWLVPFGQSSCEVMLDALPPQALGSLELERTRMVAQGRVEAIDSLKRRFDLRFLSAGG